jgi:tight adherence protein B
MIAGMALLKCACLAAGAFCASTIVVAYAHAPDSPLRVRWLRYLQSLDRSLTILGSETKGRTIGRIQLVLVPIALFASVAMRLSAGRTVVLMLAVVFGPRLWLARKLTKRCERIETDVTSFLVALANSLKASPSLGKAFTRVEQVLSGPLAAELRTVTRDIRLGASIEQALLALGARAPSPSMDAALTGILIGRQVGGNLPEILETTAATLRDIERLNGIVKAKTAEGKAQMYVIALAPPLVFYAFDSLNHKYFDPLTDNLLGILLLAASCVFWISAVILAKSILTVDV